MAVARAAAGDAPLHEYLRPAGVTPRLPVPHFNVLNGGAHAANALDFQEFMVAPIGAPSMAEAVRAGADVYRALRKLLADAGFATGLGDEGGFAPDIAKPEDVLALLVRAIEAAGYPTGRAGVAIALDPAASEFYRDGAYHVAGETLTSADMAERYAAMVATYPVWSIEDGLAEGDWDGWVTLTERLGASTQLVGDDIFVTNPAIIAEAIERKVANSALIKLNQIGSVTETLEAMRLCREAGYTQMVSHRSGETEDSLHRRPRGGDRLRPAQDRRPRAWRAGREVQPVDRGRRRHGSALRPGLSVTARGPWRGSAASADPATGAAPGRRGGVVVVWRTVQRPTPSRGRVQLRRRAR